jgi:hypothetical protein
MPSKRRPAKRSKGWEASLAHVVTIMRGPTLKTLAEARAYILTLPKGKQARWEIAVRCLLRAAESGSAEGHQGAFRQPAHSAQATITLGATLNLQIFCIALPEFQQSTSHAGRQ